VRPFHPDEPGATDVLDRPDGPQADGYSPADDRGPAGAPAPGPAAEVDRAATPGFRRPALVAFGRALGIGGDYGPEGSIWHILTHSRFRWYFAGSVVSNLGTWLQNVAQVVLAYQLTRHSVFAVGMVSCAQFSSPLLLGPWAGKLTNRIGSWRVLIVTQCLSAAIAAALAALELTHALTVPVLYAGATLVGLAFTFALPAQSVIVASLAPPGETKKALALDSVSYNLGRALAPVFGVLIFATIGFGWAFALNAGSFCFFTVVLLRQRPRDVRPEPGQSRVWNGFRIAREEPRIMVVLLMVAAVTVAADPILVLGPAVAHSFGESADWSGIFIAALGAGNVLGSLRPVRQLASVRRAATVLAVLSLAMMVFVTAPWIWLSILAAATAGMACLLEGAQTRALLLQAAGPDRQAAVMAAWAVAWAGSKPIASLADGSLARLVGVRPTGILLATPALLPALALIMLLVVDKLSYQAPLSAWLTEAKGHH
jgi:predicted MFS family arabinose efflux permease